MTPPYLLSAIRLGQSALNDKHKALAILWKQFSVSVRNERKQRKIKLCKFARDLGCTATFAGMLEKGRRPWTMERAELAVKLLTRREDWPD